MNKKTLLTNRVYLIIFAATISVALFSLLFGITKLEREFEKKVLDVVTTDIIEITNNTAKSIKQTLIGSSNYVQSIKDSIVIQNQIDNKLSTLLTKNIKYAYLLYKDEKGVFRFLADGAPQKEKAFFNQKFDVESNRWYEIFQTKKPVLIEQPLLKQLSITYLKPILKTEDVQLILAIDFSVEKTNDVNEIIDMVKNIIISIIFIVLIFILILIYQLLRYITVKKSIYIDKLTNVYNRNYLQEYEDSINLDDYIIAAIDIDYFKKVNDTYGHDAGDIVLKEVARTMLESTRLNEDIVIRYGGEEFLILAKKVNNEDSNHLNVIERVFHNIGNRDFILSDGTIIRITVSIGLNLTPNESRNFKQAFKLADDALYLAKKKGRNQIEIN